MKGLPRVVILGLAACLLWHLALRRHGLELPLIIDEGEYAYEARTLMTGGLPYVDAYSPKPPVVFFLYRAAYAAWLKPYAPRFLAMFGTWLAMLLLFAMTPAGWAWGARLAAPAALGVLCAAPVGDMGFSASAEAFLAVFMTVAAYFLSRHWSGKKGLPLVLCGLFAGAAFMTKQTALWSCLGFAALLAWSEPKKAKGALARYGAGLLIVPAACVLYFWARGGLGPFWEQAFARNARYAGLVSGGPALKAQLSWAAGTLAPQLLAGLWPIVLLAGLGLSKMKVSRQGRSQVLVAVWLGTAGMGVMTGLYFFPHYFLQAWPALALACALGVETLAKGRRREAIAVGLLLTLSVYPGLIGARTHFIDMPEVTAKKLLYPNPVFETMPLASYIRSNSAPQDTVYIYGAEPQIYIQAQRRAATPHLTSLPFTMFATSWSPAEAELARLEAAPPKFFIYSGQPQSAIIASALGLRFRDAIRALLLRRYKYIARVEVTAEPTPFFPLITPRPEWGEVLNFDSPTDLLLFERE